MKNIPTKVPFCLWMMGVLFYLIGFQNAHTYSSGNFAARTNAPGESSCASSSCHGSGALGGSGSTSISLEGNPSEYEAGQTYTITVNTDDLLGNLFGMQMTALAGEEITGSSVSAGSFIAPIGMQIRTQANREYIVHQNTNNGTGTWTFEWTAPDENVGPVTFYLAALAANGNGAKTGDKVYFNTLTLDAPAMAMCPSGFDLVSYTISICESESIVLESLVTIEGEGESEINWYDENGDLYLDNFVLNENMDCSPKLRTFTAEAICLTDGSVIGAQNLFMNLYPLNENLVNAVTLEGEGTCTTSISINDDCATFISAEELSQMASDNQEGVHEYSISINDPLNADCNEDFIVSIPFSCNPAIDCMAAAGGIGNLETEYCLDQEITFTIAEYNTDSSYTQKYVLTDDGNQVLEVLAPQLNLGTFEEGIYCLYPLNYYNVNGFDLPEVGDNLNEYVANATGCFALDLEDCFGFSVLDCTPMMGYRDLQNIELQSIRFVGDALQVQISSTDYLDAQLALSDLYGRPIKQENHQLGPQSNLQWNDLSRLSSGIYLLSILDEAGAVLHTWKVLR